jgi:V/A-type H+/Na+-transporting ATPase subunit E
MKEIETGKEKIQKICDLLKKETLDPAKQEAKEIIENAEMQAAQILERAKEEGGLLLQRTREEVEKRKQIFEDSLQFSTRQVLEELKQAIEKKFFRENLRAILLEKMSKEDVIAELLKVVVEAIRKEGTETDLTATISKKIPPEKIAVLLGSKIIEQLKNKEILLGEFEGGVRIRLEKNNLTIDLSDEALRDLIVEYVREDFRHLFFQK